MEQSDSLSSQKSDHYDVIVLGLGSMGSAACWFLARRGYRVLGLEQFKIPHENGSHAGQSRIIRKAYFEHSDYVPLLERAYQNWHLLEKETGKKVYHKTGLLYAGKPDHENIKGIRNSASLYDISLDRLSVSEAQEKYRAVRLPEDYEVLFEPDAGFARPELAVGLYAQDAVRLGAVVLAETPVLSWDAGPHHISVVTAEATLTCDKLIITAGAWTSEVIPSIPVELTVTRQTLAWIDTSAQRDFDLGHLPCWLIEDPARGIYYGFPVLPTDQFGGPAGFKLAHHFPGRPCSADNVDRRITAEDEGEILYGLKKYFPAAGENILSMKTCLYTNSRDTDFIIDHLPGYEKRVTVACGFSGHGFKFIPAVGEILADLAMEGKTDLPIGFLRISRFEK